MRRLLIAIAAAMPLIAGAADAKNICGSKVITEKDEVRVFLGHYMAVCEDNGRCRAMTYQTDPKSGVPWTHRLAVMRDGKEASWLIELTLDKGQIDINEGYDLTIDHKPAMRVPPEAIKVPRAANDYYFNADLNDAVLKDLGAGGNLTWDYVMAGGKEAGKANMSLAGLRKSMRWITCMQNR